MAAKGGWAMFNRREAFGGLAVAAAALTGLTPTYAVAQGAAAWTPMALTPAQARTLDASIRENEKAMRKDMQTAAAEMLEAAGFQGVRTIDGDYGPGLGIHEMGTARMGRDPKTSVLNAFNQVHECKNVYVTDGSAMASSSCVNPSLTYMALTARAVDHAVASRRTGEL